MYIRGYIKSIYPELALSGSKNECASTDIVFLPIYQVCTSGVTLPNSKKGVSEDVLWWVITLM